MLLLIVAFVSVQVGLCVVGPNGTHKQDGAFFPQ